ncbi:two-component system, OmpR family, phosphate regulon sensor histidine kinase PhoR [Lishizhenia tianjinensis]|uniref:histidine kinase n=1 Tax=Lishizhenia tianjinensis TaxID=477690 RepID=A0A1I7BQT0_9FLAO|nr:HAMP domain-containing sensor histidine kinase [Lishizhenia tianjinensis]SFT89537.1 two-component system, OmpR family, phosphate regulon sensor histidine kinase PhoR [Lishizhenia tianjinensis]
MQRKTINTVIVLGICSILSILVIQAFWINSTLKAQETNINIQAKQDSLQLRQFHEQVKVALRNVTEEISTYIADSSDLYGRVKQVSTNYYQVDINEDLHPYYLEQLLKREFYDQNITQSFQYGIYDCFNDSIVFGNIIRYSTEKYYEPISDTVAGITSPNLDWDQEDGHYFTVFFPNVTPISLANYPRSRSPWMYLIAIVAFILLFFAYSIRVIIRQKRLSEVKTDFINNMTHELKTPISTIALSSETILREDLSQDKERLERYASIIYKENKRLENQVERVLNVAKLDKEELKLSKSVFSLHEILEEAKDNFEFNQLKDKGQISLELNARKDEVFADEVHITNVIFNLLDNAIKYCEVNPDIHIVTNNYNQGVALKITDNGIGMKKEDQRMIFDKFYRVPTGNLHNVKGFGLGLYYVKLIVEQHGGSIKVNSNLGEGTTFTIFLPFK